VDFTLNRKDAAVSCCGEKRASLRRRTQIAAAPADPVPAGSPPPRAAAPPEPEVMVEYRGALGALVHRAASGRLYTFTHARRARSVASADAPLLLQDRDFRLAEPTQQGG